MGFKLLGAIIASLITLTRGRVIVGNSSGVGAELDISGAGKMVQGNGTDAVAVTYAAAAAATTDAGGTGATASSTASITMGGSTAADGTGATGSDGTGATGSSTATVSTSPRVASATFANPAAAGANIIAQMAADTDETAWGNITQPDVPRVAQADFSATWDGGNIEITGLREDTGDDGTDTIVASAGNIVQGTKPFRLIRRVRNLGTRGAGTCDVECGVALGVPCQGLTPTLLECYETSVHGRDTGAAISATGGLTVTEAPDGVHDYTAVYSLAVVSTDSGHTHTGPSHTHTGPSHTHAATGLSATDAGHTHTGPSHTHTSTATHTHIS